MPSKKNLEKTLLKIKIEIRNSNPTIHCWPKTFPLFSANQNSNNPKTKIPKSIYIQYIKVQNLVQILWYNTKDV
jgi:hypothetical protein